MNFLAHTYLSFGDPGLIVGNYLGDFIKNKHLEKLPASIAKGVYLHRAIDSFTDHHDLVKAGTKLLHPDFRKYAPVVLDIYFDFLLSKFWSRFSETDLTTFCSQTYQQLLAAQVFMPEFMQGRVVRMTSGRWLENYQSYVGLQRTFNYIKSRSSFPSKLDMASELLLAKESELGAIFLSFFPELIAFCVDHTAVKGSEI